MADIIALPLELSQPIPLVTGNNDYKIFKNTLARINELLHLSGIDNIIMQYDLDEAEKNARKDAEKNNKKFKGLSYKQKLKIQKLSKQKIRYLISRKLTGESFRKFSIHLAESHLLQQFCGIDRLGVINVASKSALDRFEKAIPEGIIRYLNTMLIEAARSPVNTEETNNKLLLKNEIKTADYYLDTTCVKANIHYPVDWVLLRDATKTLMKSIILVRKYGLKNRMAGPSEFIKGINKLCIEMTHTRNRKDSKRKRKEIFRLMKKLLKKVRGHGQKYRDLLKSNWKQTELTENQTKGIIERMDNILSKLPDAVKQAHERIIGGRLVNNKDKILSLYEADAHVIVRGKPDAKTEFGNILLIGETKDGLIIDWKLYKDTAPSDSKLLPESLLRIEMNYNGLKLENVVTDRGFDSPGNKKILKSKGLNNCMCPRSPKELGERMQTDDFRFQQKRRGQTEGRIGIIKNNFLGRPLKSKGFKYREQSVSWAILTHNLWVLSRLPKVEVEQIISSQRA
jgi:hypothetical protein